MDNYRTEEEQLEVLKRWWRENGRSTVIAIVLAASLGLGWQAWQRSRDAAAQEGSMRYQALLEALDAQQSGAATGTTVEPRGLAQGLRADFPGSVYGQLAALHLAQLAVRDGDLDEAEAQLRWVLDKAPEPLAEIARLRLARVLAGAGETEAALAQLGDPGDGSLAAAFAMARGDVLLGAGRSDEALAAYREAAAGLQAAPALPPSLREKIEYLSPVAPQASVPEATIDESDTGDAAAEAL